MISHLRCKFSRTLHDAGAGIQKILWSSCSLLKSLELLLQLHHLWICLNLLLAVAKLFHQPFAILFNRAHELLHFFLLLGAQCTLLLATALVFACLLCTSRALFLLQLVHPRHHLCNLRILVLLSAAQTLSFELRLARNNLVLQVLQLLTLFFADASAFLLLGLFLLHLFFGSA